MSSVQHNDAAFNAGVPRRPLIHDGNTDTRIDAKRQFPRAHLWMNIQVEVRLREARLRDFAKPAMTAKEAEVAEAVWASVHDATGQLRVPAGADAVALASAA